VTTTATVGIMGARIWALLLATVRGTYWRCEAFTGDRPFEGTYWTEGLERHVLVRGLGEVRTGDRAFGVAYWREGLAKYVLAL